MSTEEVKVEQKFDWTKFLKKHYGIVAIFIAVGVLAFVGAVYVFLWFVGQAQSISLVPSSLGLWTMNNMVMFLLHLIFWEVVCIGIPLIVMAIAGWQWWKRLPEEEKKEYHFGKGSNTSKAGGAISPLFCIAFIIKVYIDGKWDVAVSTWTLDYVVGSMITILIWCAIIFGIPMLIGGIWWIHHEITKKS